MLFSEWAFRLMFVRANVRRDGLMFVGFCKPDAVSISIFNALYRIKIVFDFRFATLPRQEAEC